MIGFFSKLASPTNDTAGHVWAAKYDNPMQIHLQMHFCVVLVLRLVNVIFEII